MMTRIPLAPTLLTLAAALNSAAPAFGADRCAADLSRINTTACIANVNLEGQTGVAPTSPLSFNWQVNDGVFDLVTPLCLTAAGGVGNRADMMLAIDRSQSIWAVDNSLVASANDNLSHATYVVNKLAAEAQINPSQAPKVGLMLFSSVANCAEYTGSDVIVDKEFPCLYVSAKSIADATQVKKLLALLAASAGKYSEGGVANSGDLTIPVQLLTASGAGLTVQAQPNGLLLFSDGRSFKGQGGDVYSYLESAAYALAEKNALSAFGALKSYRLAFALSPALAPAIDSTNDDAYDTMCGLINAPRNGDCDTTKVAFTDPTTWPVNKLNIPAFAANLVGVSANVASGAATVAAPGDVDPLLDTLRIAAQVPASIDGALVSVNGAPPFAGTVNGSRVTFTALPGGQALKLEVTIASAGAQLKFPLQINTAQVPDTGILLSDQEMQCAADPVSAATVPPAGRLNLRNLQGGSASCGVTAAGTPDASPLALIILLLPLAAAALLSLRRPLPFRASAVKLGRLHTLAAASILVAAASTAPPAKADTVGGLNTLQYRPVVDGVANTEKATTLGAGAYNVGLFLSYASDPLDLGGDKNQKVSAVENNLTTAHAVANIGILDRVTLGVHVPYVQNSEEDRAVSGADQKSANLGRPADVEALLKINFVRRQAWALGIAPLATIPTGDPALLIGDGTANYGGLFLLSGIQGPWSWAFDAGYLQRQKALVLADDRANTVTVTGQSLTYAGVEYRKSPRLAFGASMQAKFASGEAIDFTSSSPAEWAALTKFRPVSGLELEAGGGTGIGKGYGSPAYRVFAGITYVPESSSSTTREPGKTVVAKPTPAPVAPPGAAKGVAKGK